MLVLYVSDTAAVCVLSARRHPAHPVSVPILPPREIQVTWLYVLLVRVLLAIFLIYLVSWSTETVFFFFPSHFLSSSPFFSLPPSYTAVTQIRIRGHIAEVLLPPPYYGSCLAFLWREAFISLFLRPLAASHCTYPRWALTQLLVLFSFLANILKNSPRRGFEHTDQHKRTAEV